MPDYKENIGDEVFKGAMERFQEVGKYVHEQFGTKKEFRKELVKPIDQLYKFDMMTEEDIMGFINQFGPEGWATLNIEMDKIRRRHKNA